MRPRTALTVALLIALTGLGVPSALADDTPPAPAPTAVIDDAVAGETGSVAVEPSNLETPDEVTPTETAPTIEPTSEPTGDGSAPTETAAETETPAEPAEGQSDAGSVTGGAAAGSKPDFSEQPPVVGSADNEPGELSAAAATSGWDPRASIGDIDCTTLTIPVTLDNSRSSQSVLYLVEAQDASFDSVYQEEVRVAAGGTQVVNVAVLEDTEVQLSASALDPPPEHQDIDEGQPFATMRVDCVDDNQTHDPHARIGDLDCAAHTVPVTLDNTRSEDATSFLVLTYNDTNGDSWEDTFDVSAGATRVVQVAVTEDSWVYVFVGDDAVLEETDWGEGRLANEGVDVDCAPDAIPTIGDVNCNTHTVPVTLDNTQHDSAVHYLVFTGESDEDAWENPAYDREVIVPAGMQRVLQVPVTGRSTMSLVVLVIGDSDRGIHVVIEVNCTTTPAARGVPATGVLGTKLAQTGGFTMALPIGAIALLGCGGVLLLIGRKPEQVTR